MRLFCGPAKSSGNISIASEAGPCKGPLIVWEVWGSSVYFDATASSGKMIAFKYHVAFKLAGKYKVLYQSWVFGADSLYHKRAPHSSGSKRTSSTASHRFPPAAPPKQATHTRAPPFHWPASRTQHQRASQQNRCLRRYRLVQVPSEHSCSSTPLGAQRPRRSRRPDRVELKTGSAAQPPAALREIEVSIASARGDENSSEGNGIRVFGVRDTDSRSHPFFAPVHLSRLPRVEEAGLEQGFFLGGTSYSRITTP